MKTQLELRLGGTWAEVVPASSAVVARPAPTSAQFFEQRLKRGAAAAATTSVKVKAEGGPAAESKKIGVMSMAGAAAGAATDEQAAIPFPAELLFLRTSVQQPPHEQMDWWTLQQAVQQRLALLRFVAAHVSDNDDDLLAADKVDDRLKSLGFVRLRWTQTEDYSAALRREEFSHFLLRLALRNNSAGREWFVHQEAALISLRLQHLRKDCEARGLTLPISRLLAHLGIAHTVVEQADPSEKHAVLSLLPGSRAATALNAPIYKMPCFPAATWLIRRKLVYLKDGVAHVPSPIIVEGVLCPTAVRNLWRSFDRLRRRNDEIESWLCEAPSLKAMLISVSDEYLGVSANPARGPEEAVALDLANLEQMSLRSFPPCMRLLFDRLKKQHHLKNTGRLQLWLFLKSAGMTVADQLHWWGSLWDDPKMYEKEIRYHIRHAYGLEGNRKSYGCYNCRKILAMPRPAGGLEVHGCPFAHLESDALKKFLGDRFGVSAAEQAVITQMAASRDHQLACLRVFALRHGGNEGDNVGNHPTTWFEESAAYWAKKKAHDAL